MVAVIVSIQLTIVMAILLCLWKPTFVEANTLVKTSNKDKLSTDDERFHNILGSFKTKLAKIKSECCRALREKNSECPATEMEVTDVISHANRSILVGPDGLKLAEEGIILNELQMERLLHNCSDENLRRRGKHAVKRRRTKRQSELGRDIDLWVDRSGTPVLYYAYQNDAFDSNQKAIIETAVNMWRLSTCITFTEIDPNNFNDSYVLFHKHDSMCASLIGRLQGSGMQAIYLSTGCLHITSIAHEIGHSLGLWHEQNRPDRDNYVTIHFENVKIGTEYNFHKKADYNIYGVSYDIHSPMQYGSQDYSTQFGVDTITSNDPVEKLSMGKGDSFFGPVQLINKAYCDDKCAHSTTKCLYGGYSNPGDECTTCICPNGLGGIDCSIAQSQPVASSCLADNTIVIGKDGNINIASPNYGIGAYSYKDECTWVVKSPEGTQMELQFQGDFSMLGYDYNDYDNPCLICWDHVQVKYKSTESGGSTFCCRKTPTHKLKSGSNVIIVVMKTYQVDGWSSIRVGFNLNIKVT